MPKYEVGKYECEITGQGFQKASTGNMQLVLQFKVLGKIDTSDPNTLLAVMPGERKMFRTITENTVDWIMDDLKALGVDSLSSWAQLDPNTEGAIDLTGRKADMTCGSKTGNDGKSYEDWAIAGSGGGGKPIEHAASKEVKALDRLFGKHLKKEAAPAPRRAPALVPATAMAEEDVPF